MSDSMREWGENTDAAIRRRNLKLTDLQILRVSQRVIPKSCKRMAEQERFEGTRQMIRDLERMAGDDGCIAAAWALDYISAVNEAPQSQLTPIHKTPSHVDHYDYGNDGDQEEHYSRVFHRDHPGRIVAVFYGPNHRADSKAFCDWCQQRDERTL